MSLSLAPFARPDLTYNVQAAYWMAEAVYRHYLDPTPPNSVEGVTVSFWEESTAEPMFLLRRVRYKFDNALIEIKGICKEWDLWNLYFKWGERQADAVLEYEGIESRKDRLGAPDCSAPFLDRFDRAGKGVKQSFRRLPNLD
jgi:hypothetical protein